MKKKTKISNSLLIGIFVIVGLSLLVVFLLWMGATQFFKEYEYYVTYFEESVDGLESGSSIKYLGVSCGLVDKISVAPDGKLVEVILKLDTALLIRDDVIAKLESSGLAGGKYIQLVNDVDRHPSLELSFALPEYIINSKQVRLINSAPSQFKEITQSAESIVSQLNEFRWKEISDELVETLEGINKFVGGLNIADVISDLRGTTHSLNLLMKELSESAITENLELTSTSISNTAKTLENTSLKLDSKIDSINITGYLDKIYSDIHTTVNNANATIDVLSNRFQSSILGINVLLEDISKTNKKLNTTLRTINESPYILLTDPPPPDNVKK